VHYLRVVLPSEIQAAELEQDLEKKESRRLSTTLEKQKESASSQTDELKVKIPKEQPNLIEKIYADEITPLNDITDDEKFNRIKEKMESEGWKGRPIVAIERGRGPEALTGSHRIHAATEIGLDDIPTVIVDASDVDSDILEKLFDADDWTKPEVAKQFMPKYAVDLLKVEGELLDIQLGI
jgi:hypothetical protein